MRPLEIILVVMLGLCSFAVAQDTIAPGMSNYSDIVADWKDQDQIGSRGYRAVIASIISLPGLDEGEKVLLQDRLAGFAGKGERSPELANLYLRACGARRAARMNPYLEKFRRVIFSQHPVLGGYYFYAGVPKHSGYNGKGLELLTMNGIFGTVTHLLPDGEARDPCVSFDGTRVLFSWRKGSSGSKSYHLYEMNLIDRSVRQITRDGVSGPCNDYEAAYLPNGNILFVSTRHIQQVDCVSGRQRVGNFFLCDRDGNFVRRIAFDQSPTDYPVVMPSGEVVYCRWDYNDKAHTYGHGVFIMNPDGTAQREYCNNNSWWPTMILQPRPIPGTNKIMAMIGGYHTPQQGKIGIIDVSQGMQNGEGITLLAPIRSPRDNTLERWGSKPTSTYRKLFSFDESKMPHSTAYPLDKWGQNPPLFCYPYPFDENAFLVSFRPEGKGRFGLFFMLANGERELLFYDPKGSCMAAVAAVVKPKPPVLSSTVDYRDSTGVFQIMNIYTSQSPVLDGVAPGTIKRLRVLALNYRSGPPIGGSSHYGAGCINYGGASYNSPIAVSSASWDAKIVVGETPVYEDGSASFIAPARMPLFFQALDEKGHMVQTMRSWTMVQPGEKAACMGCHESKLSAPPPPAYVPQAMKIGPKPLEPFYGPVRGFSFAKEIQPIFDAKCVRCHNGSGPAKLDLRGERHVLSSERRWPASYRILTSHRRGVSGNDYVNWLNAEDSPLLQPPYRGGSCKSPLVSLLEAGHQDAIVTQEDLDKIRCWIDMGVPCFADYGEGVTSSSSRKALEKQLALRALWEKEERQNISAYIGSRPAYGTSPKPSPPVTVLDPQLRAVSSAGMIKVSFTVAENSGKQPVRIQLFDLRGALVKTLLHERKPAGRHSERFQRCGFSAGHYVLRLQMAGVTKTIPCIIY